MAEENLSSKPLSEEQLRLLVLQIEEQRRQSKQSEKLQENLIGEIKTLGNIFSGVYKNNEKLLKNLNENILDLSDLNEKELKTLIDSMNNNKVIIELTKKYEKTAKLEKEEVQKLRDEYKKEIKNNNIFNTSLMKSINNLGFLIEYSTEEFALSNKTSIDLLEEIKKGNKDAFEYYSDQKSRERKLKQKEKDETFIDKLLRGVKETTAKDKSRSDRIKQIEESNLSKSSKEKEIKKIQSEDSGFSGYAKSFLKASTSSLSDKIVEGFKGTGIGKAAYTAHDIVDAIRTGGDSSLSKSEKNIKQTETDYYDFMEQVKYSEKKLSEMPDYLKVFEKNMKQFTKEDFAKKSQSYMKDAEFFAKQKENKDYIKSDLNTKKAVSETTKKASFLSPENDSSEDVTKILKERLPKGDGELSFLTKKAYKAMTEKGSIYTHDIHAESILEKLLKIEENRKIRERDESLEQMDERERKSIVSKSKINDNGGNLISNKAKQDTGGSLIEDVYNFFSGKRGSSFLGKGKSFLGKAIPRAGGLIARGAGMAGSALSSAGSAIAGLGGGGLAGAATVIGGVGAAAAGGAALGTLMYRYLPSWIPFTKASWDKMREEEREEGLKRAKDVAEKEFKVTESMKETGLSKKLGGKNDRQNLNMMHGASTTKEGLQELIKEKGLSKDDLGTFETELADKVVLQEKTLARNKKEGKDTKAQEQLLKQAKERLSNVKSVKESFDFEAVKKDKIETKITKDEGIKKEDDVKIIKARGDNIATNETASYSDGDNVAVLLKKILSVLEGTHELESTKVENQKTESYRGAMNGLVGSTGGSLRSHDSFSMTNKAVDPNLQISMI